MNDTTQITDLLEEILSVLEDIEHRMFYEFDNAPDPDTLPSNQ